MGNKRKGQLTSDSEWHKHLRKIGKRFFWKGERKAGKKMIEENLSKNEIDLLTFDELFDLIEENILSENEKLIAEKIIDSERDWRTSSETLNDFITELEYEIGEPVTKISLNRLMSVYKRNILKFAWEAESIFYLLEIFSLTEETNLRNIFIELTERVKTKI